MKFFNRKKPASGNETNKTDSVHDVSSTSKFQQSIERRKIAVSEKLTEWSERVSPGTRKAAFIAFGIGISLISLSLILSPLTRPLPAKRSVFPDLQQPVLPHLKSEPPISQEDFRTMVIFKHMLDSLRSNDPAAYRMLIEERQGLVDSIDFLIQYSQKQ